MIFQPSSDQYGAIFGVRIAGILEIGEIWTGDRYICQNILNGESDILHFRIEYLLIEFERRR